MAVRVQRDDFDLGAELAALRAGRADIGALVSFTGLVRSDAGDVGGMELEHYPGMTEKALAGIEAEAQAHWPLQASLVIHRYGALAPGEQIMMVARVVGVARVGDLGVQVGRERCGQRGDDRGCGADTRPDRHVGGVATRAQPDEVPVVRDLEW
jgi:hypothetical protein